MVTDYRYDAQGTRRVKYSRVYGETLYADRMYQEHVGTTPTAAVTKHIFVGQTRIASKLHYSDQTPSTRALYMQQNTFYYHPDHLGSTNWVTDHQGEGYEHFTYTPYGEAWVEEHLLSKIHRMNHRFTGQELDPETGLYAFPARNYDPRTSRWLSADPALEEYLPVAPISEQAREHNQNLPGMGGVFTPVNLQIYHYGANNPLKYVDPDGRVVFLIGGSTTAGAGTGVTGGSGVFISYNQDEGARVGIYSNHGGGFFGGMSAGVYLEGSVSFAKSIDDITGLGISIGGSGTVAGISVGGEVTIPVGSGLRNAVFTVVAGADAAAVSAEGHMIPTMTNILLELDLSPEAAAAIQDLATDFLDSATSGDLGPEIVSDFMQTAQEIIDTLIITAKEAEVK